MPEEFYREFGGRQREFKSEYEPPKVCPLFKIILLIIVVKTCAETTFKLATCYRFV